LRVSDLDATVAVLRAEGVTLRREIAAGVAVDTALVADPSGNLVELFEPRAGYHERTTTKE
jgi:catechol 2,3-dioxygenase-like lactoylglutathione lyase family enzyme